MRPPTVNVPPPQLPIFLYEEAVIEVWREAMRQCPILGPQTPTAGLLGSTANHPAGRLHLSRPRHRHPRHDQSAPTHGWPVLLHHRPPEQYPPAGCPQRQPGTGHNRPLPALWRLPGQCPHRHPLNRARLHRPPREPGDRVDLHECPLLQPHHW